MDVTVVGLGLIGGSVLRAMARHGHRTRGYDADPATRAAASRASATAPSDDRWTVADTVRAAVTGADLVVLAVPLPAVAGVLGDLVDIGYRGLVTDVTSVKTPVRDLLDRAGRTARFIGGHPMAGRETSGFAAAEPDLFTGCAWVLCLEPEETSLDAWSTVAALVTGLGARVVPATAAEHDRAVAAISHVPHLLASTLAATAAENPLALALAAGSFRDGTRVAASSPDLVAAMCGGNAAAVAPVLDRVRAALDQARAALDSPDPIAALRPWLAPGRAARVGWPPRPGTRTELPIGADELLALGRAGGWITAVATDRGTVTAVRPA